MTLSPTAVADPPSQTIGVVPGILSGEAVGLPSLTASDPNACGATPQFIRQLMAAALKELSAEEQGGFWTRLEEAFGPDLQRLESCDKETLIRLTLAIAKEREAALMRARGKRSREEVKQARKEAVAEADAHSAGKPKKAKDIAKPVNTALEAKGYKPVTVRIIQEVRRELKAV